jgi:hypothetical protein
VSLKSLFLSCLLPCWWAISPGGHSGPVEAAPARAGLDIVWQGERADATYRLRGRFSINGLSNGFSTSVSNESDPDRLVTHLELAPGMYSLTLSDGFELLRLAPTGESLHPESGAAGEQRLEESVPAQLLSANPLIVIAEAGRTTPAGLSLVSRPVERPAGQLLCSND